MEDKVKNFDRSIEQAMNETSVTPPFGMWNRISAELDVPAPAPTSWVSSSLVPKAVLMGLVTVAVLEATLLVGYVYNNSTVTNKNITAQNITHSQAPVQARSIISIPDVEPLQIAALPQQEASVSLSRRIKVAPVSISKPVDKNAVGVEQANNELTEMAANSEVAVPQQETKSTNGIGVATETYYFPPVDINKPEHQVSEKETSTAIAAVAPDEDEAAADKKTKLGKEPKSNFKPHKHHQRHLGFVSYRNK